MTKEDLVAQFMESVSGNRPTDDTSGLHENVLVGYLSLAYGKMITAAANQNRQHRFRMFNEHVYVDSAVPLEKTGNDRVFMLKPTMSAVTLPGQEGIRSVYPTNRPVDALTYRAKSGVKMMSTLHEALGNNSKGSYSIIPSGIMVYDYNGDCKTFDIDIVASLESIDWDDNVNLPEGGQDVLFGIAKELYFPRVREDKINDGR